MDTKFELFKGTSEEDLVWIESVNGLEQANRRLQDMAPGDYFIFDLASRRIIARLHKTVHAEKEE